MEKLEETILGKLFGEGAEKDSADSCPVPGGALPKNMALAMAYVPYQQWEQPYETDVALDRGTIFPCLDKPFIGEEAVKRADTE